MAKKEKLNFTRVSSVAAITVLTGAGVLELGDSARRLYKSHTQQTEIRQHPERVNRADAIHNYETGAAEGLLGLTMLVSAAGMTLREKEELQREKSDQSLTR